MDKVKKANVNSKRLQFTPDVSEIFQSSRYLQPYSLYFHINKVICNKLNFQKIDKNRLMDIICNEFNLEKGDLIISKSFDFDTNEYKFNTVIIPIRKDLFIYFNPGIEDIPSVEILYNADVPALMIDRLVELIKTCYTKTSSIGKIFLLQVQEYGGYDLSPFTINSNEIDICKNYNDDFEQVNSVIKTRLNTDNDKGLVLLHGKPGTGKTSYIRYLTSQINKRMIFLSPEMMSKISSPEFIGILSAYPNSVIIIEDAENIIEERVGGGSSAISNLLNLTDGLLADCLKIQLLCTFNTDVSRIDKALLRKGRMIAIYEFKDLEQQKAQQLSDSLGYKNNINKNTPLSEIFNTEENVFQEEKVLKIGFNFNNSKVA